MLAFIKRTRWALSIFFILPIIGVLITKGFNFHFDVNIANEFWRTIIISISTSLFSTGIVYIFIDNRLHELNALDDEITIVLNSEKYQPINCPSMLRKDFCRSEVLGYIGMIKMKEEQKRFKIAETMTEKFAQEIQRIHKSKGDDRLTIHCSNDEIEQFDKSLVKIK